MGTGNKLNNRATVEGQSFEDRYDIAHAVALNLSCKMESDDRIDYPRFVYFGTAAIAATLTALISCPKGTEVWDMQAHITHEKTGAKGTDTWVHSAART